MKKVHSTKNELQTANSRRNFLKNSAALATLATTGPLTGFSPLAMVEQKPASSGINGIQIGAVSFVDEGVDAVLDILQKRGSINTIFLTTFTYGRGLAGRQIPGQPFPDHGSKESDERTFHGGNYATPHPQFYANTALKETRAPEHGNLDIIEAVLPKARKRGMKFFCSCEDVWRSSVPNYEKTTEVDLQGRKSGGQCSLNPDVRNFWTSLVTDYCKSYDVDGILFFTERNGPLFNDRGRSHYQSC